MIKQKLNILHEGQSRFKLSSKRDPNSNVFLSVNSVMYSRPSFFINENEIIWMNIPFHLSPTDEVVVRYFESAE